VYAKSYLDLVNRAPYALGYFYDLLDKKPSPQHKSDRFRRFVETLNMRPFLKLLQKQSWDIIVNTHFLPAEIVAMLRRHAAIDTPQITATTDFETHRLWVNQPCDHYFTATEEGKLNLQSWGVPAADITVSGIPIDPVFSEEKDRKKCLKQQGLAGDRPILLQLGGGFGVGPVEKIFGSLLELEKPVELVVVAGRNADLKKRLEKIETPKRHRVHVLGFTTEIDELMAVADLVVSKPGGLTTSETLARGAAMAVVNPIPGQESRNSDFLLENAAAVKINNLSTLTYKLNQVLGNPARLAELKQNAKRLGRPQAAFDVARMAIDW
jgi:processive 1,2-diacylglycerol beta-glucosyltransferase